MLPAFQCLLYIPKKTQQQHKTRIRFTACLDDLKNLIAEPIICLVFIPLLRLSTLFEWEILNTLKLRKLPDHFNVLNLKRINWTFEFWKVMSIYYLAPNIIFSIHIKTAKMIYRIFEGIPTLGHIFRSIIGSIYVEGIQVISNRLPLVCRKRWPNGIWDPISHMLWQNEKKTSLLKSRKYRACAFIWYPSSTMAKSSLDWNSQSIKISRNHCFAIAIWYCSLPFGRKQISFKWGFLPILNTRSIF